MSAAEPLWMQTMRSRARERFEGMAWPAPSAEEWRRTDLSRWDLSPFSPSILAHPDSPREAAAGKTAGFVRFEASQCKEIALSPLLRDRGVRFLPLGPALREMEASLHAAWQDGLEAADNRFLALHYASECHGALLWVPAGVEIAEPFFIDFEEIGLRGTATSPHVTVILGDGARASVVQRVAAHAADTGAGLLCNAVIDLRLGDAAGLRFCEVQELGSEAMYIRHARATVGRDSSLSHVDAELGSRLAKTRIECTLQGPGADARLDGVYFCGAGQHMDLRTVQNHASPRATSRATYKGAVVSGGRSVFQGLIEVAPGAAGTDAFLANRNLLLGDTARSDSIPTLKIGCNDVKCSHGSTTGRLREEEMFYLQCRGLSPADAREMLVLGYFEDLLVPAPERFREQALENIRGRLREAA